MDTAAARTADAALYGRGPLVTALTRWASVVLALLALLFVWHSPHVRPWPALAVGLVYAAFNLASQLWVRRHPPARRAKVAHDVVDALAVAAGAHLTGGLTGPLWLLLLPAGRGGVRAPRPGLRPGVRSARRRARDHAGPLATTMPLAMFHAVTLLFCAFAAGSTGSYLRSARRRQEEALARLTASQERYRTLLEGIQEGVVIVQKGRVVYANSSLSTISGYAAGALRGRPFEELAPVADRGELLQRYAEWDAARACPAPSSCACSRPPARSAAPPCGRAPSSSRAGAA